MRTLVYIPKCFGNLRKSKYKIQSIVTVTKYKYYSETSVKKYETQEQEKCIIQFFFNYVPQMKIVLSKTFIKCVNGQF